MLRIFDGDVLDGEGYAEVGAHCGFQVEQYQLSQKNYYSLEICVFQLVSGDARTGDCIFTYSWSTRKDLSGFTEGYKQWISG